MKRIISIIILNLFMFEAGMAQWQQANGPYGGAVMTLEIDPITNYLYAGTFGGGVFISTNNGGSWTSKNSGITNAGLFVKDIAISGINIFAGTYRDGIFLSTNNGNTWTAVNNGLPNLNVQSLAINGTNIFAGTGAGMFLSVNNGNSWTDISNGLAGYGMGIFSIKINGSNIYAGTGDGIYLSTDNGNNWTQLKATDEYVLTLDVSGNNIFAGTNTGGIIRSTDNGMNWTYANNGLTGTNVHTILINEGRIFAGTISGGVCISTDNGDNWVPTNSGLLNTDIQSIILKGADLFAGTVGGIYYSTNYGGFWSSLNNGLSNTGIQSISVSGTNVITGTWDCGAFFSSNNGTGWGLANSGLTAKDNTFWHLNTFTINGSNIFAGTDAGIFFTNNNGLTWVPMNNGLSGYGLHVSTIAQSGGNIFAGTWGGGVYRSFDYGSTWNSVNNGFPSGFLAVRSIVIKGSYIFAGTNGSGIYLSEDNGSSWIPVNTGLSGNGLYISSLALNGNSIYAGTGAGIYLSRDNGTTWNSITTGLPDAWIESLVVNGNDILVRTSSHNVLLSRDNGISWVDTYFSQIPNSSNGTGPTAVFTYPIGINETFIFSGTSGNGVWKRSLSDFPGLTVSEDSLTIASSSNSTATFDITSNTSWTVSSDQTWSTASSESGSGNATITLTALTNTSSAARIATITVTGTDVTPRTITVTQDGSPLSGLIVSQTDVLCFGSNTGSVTVAGSGGAAPHEYKLGAGSYQSSATFGTLAAGTYTITIRDALLSTFDIQITIVQPASVLSGNITSLVNVSTIGGNDGQVTVAGMGGVSPYEYMLNSGSYQSSGTFGTLTAGSYMVTVRDANLCTFDIPVSLVIIEPNCSILSKANYITPDKLCSPVNVVWNVSYTGVTNAGTPVNIRFDWDNGTVVTVPATQTGTGNFQATATNTYTSAGNLCNYHPKATLLVNGVLCTSSTQEQVVTVWDDDDHNGGNLHINPLVYPVCFGNSANVRFQDLTQFNCVPPQERDNPNVNTRWIQWIYGTDITMTGTPVTVDGISRTFPYADDVITLPSPVTGSGVWSDVIYVANDKMVGQYFQVTLRNWNYCNPYDDPNIPGAPKDRVNGDHPPVVTTAIVLIVPYPDATITPVDTLCLNSYPVTLTTHDPGGIWSGNGVTGNIFNPAIAGEGNHTVRYEVTNSNGCSDSDEIVVTVGPPPVPTISGTESVCLNSAGNVYTSETGMTDYEWAVTGGIITAGESTNSITVTWNSSGIQTVSVNYANLSGCKADNQAIYNVSVAAALTGSITSQTNVLSFGGSSGSVTVAGYGGVPPFEYSLDSGPYQSSGTFVSLIAGSYTVTIRDSFLCIFQVPVTITQPVQPLASITTSEVSSITSTTALCGGNITGNGESIISASGVCWSTLSLPTITDSHTTDGAGTGAFASSVTGLMPGTIYYLRAYATNSSGTAYGEELSFRTLERTEPDDCLTFWYPFNGNANEETGLGADGTVNGAILTDDRFGNANSAYYFNGTSNSITIPGNLPVTNSFTISFWAFLEKENGYSNILSDGNINYGGNDFLINFRNNDIGIRADKGGTPLNYEYDSPPGMTNLNLLNRWVHVAWVMNPAGSIVYLNGARIAEVSVPGTNEGFHDDHVTIGARHVWTNMDNYFQGKLDELRIYNCILNDQEIFDLYGSDGATRPSVVTNYLTDITGTSATSGGNIISDGGSPVIGRGVCWSTSSNPTTSDNITNDGTGTGAFTSLITGLLPGTRYYLRSYATNSEGTTYGSEMNFAATSNSYANCGTATDADGNVYNTVTIGTQCWFQENLRTTKYRDGSNIPLVIDNIAWYNLTTPGFCWYNNDESTYKNSYGGLYNWYAANRNDLCPVSWHTPTDTDWTILTDYLGGEVLAGGKLKEAGIAHWDSPNTGATNETGFAALPFGIRQSGGTFSASGPGSVWWSSSENGTGSLVGWARSLYYAYNSITRFSGNKTNGIYIRCLQGEPLVPPSLTTISVTSVTASSAISGGNITDNSGSPVTSRGVCWSTSSNPTIDDNRTSDGTGSGVYTSSITGLIPGTIYYVRAYAANSAGTAYGNEISFASTVPVLTLTGSGDACIGSPASLRLDITGGMQPYTVNYTMNGVDQTVINGYASGSDIDLGILPAGTYTFMITSVLDADSNQIPAVALPPSYSIEIYDIPNAWATINNSPGLCNDGITDIIFHSSVPNSDFIYTVTYSPAVAWQSGKSPASGMQINGEGFRLSQNLAHYSTEPVIVTYTIMPQISGAVYCPGSPVIVNIIVTPEGQVNPLSDILICNGAMSPPVLFTTVNTGGTTNYAWTNSNTPIGLPASGTGSLPSFTAANAGNAPVTSTITVMPFYNSGPANCPGPTQSFTITVNPTPRVVPINVEPEICYGDYTQIVLTSPTVMNSGEIGFDYSISVPAGVTGNSSPGTDFIQGEDLSFQYRNYSDTVQSVYFSITPKVVGLNCPAGSTVIQEVRVHPKPVRGITITKPFTCDASEGLAALRAVISQGAGPYYFAWTGPVGYQMEDATEITNLYAGYYNLNVTDNLGCPGDTAIIIANLSSSPRIIPIPVLPNIHVSCPGGNNGTARIYVRDGITYPYSYQLVRNDTETLFTGVFAGNYDPSDPNTFRVCTGLMAGQYKLIIRDINGCETIRAAELKEPEPILLSFDVSNYNGSGISCYGQSDGSVTVNVTGGTGGYSFAWTGPDGFASSAENISGLRAGNYTLWVTDLSGCVLTNSVNLTEPDPLYALFEYSGISCTGASDGTISVSLPVGGSGAYEYTIDGGSTWVNSGSFTGLNSGTYDVRIRDAMSPACYRILNGALTLNNKAQIIATVTSININCFGAGNGSIIISNPSGGTGTYHFSINGGITWQGSGNFISLAPGSYDVRIRDASHPGCFVILNPALSITQPAVLTGTVTSTNVTCYGAADATINITFPTGGYGAYQYSIDGGASWQASGTFANLAPGFYSVRIRDASHTGCTLILNHALEISEPGDLNATLQSTNITCAGANDGTISITSPYGGNGTYEHSINGGASWMRSGSFIGLPSGIYNVQIRDAVQPGCSRILNSALVITEPAPLNASVSKIDDSCGKNGKGSITISGPTGGYGTYEFTINGGTTWNSSCIYNNLFSGIYNVRMRDAVHAGCEIILNQALQINTTDTFALSSPLAPPALCSGSAFYYVATSTNPAASIAWARPSVAGIAEPAHSGTGNVNEILTNNSTAPVNVNYIYTLTANGCSNVQNVTVTVYPSPSAQAGGSQTICLGNSATVNGAAFSNGTVSWTSNGGGYLSRSTTLSPAYTPAISDAGKTITLTMTVTDSGVCSSQIAEAYYSVVVKGNQTISFAPLADKVYGDSSFILTASSSSSVDVNYTCSDDSIITISGNRVTIRGTGTATIYASQPGDINHCPALTVLQTLKVAPKPITVRADSSQSKIYGDADPVLTYSVYPELAGTDGFTGSLNRDGGENTGIVYAVNQGTLTAGSNYKMTFLPGSFTISPKPVTVTPETGQNKTYGSDDPVLKFKINPELVNGDIIIGSLSRAPGENTGSYPIRTGSLSLGNNYSVTIVPADFTINKAPLNVAGDKKERRYLDSNPAFEISYSGFVRGEDKSVLDVLPSLAVLPDTLSDAGEYSITVSGGSDDNYYYEYVHGILTILKKDQTITNFNSLPKFLRTTQRFPLEATASSGLEVRFVSSDEDKATISGDVMTIENEGAVNIIAVQDGNNNWNPAPSVYQSVIGQPTFDNVTSLFTPNSDGMNDHWHIVNIEDFGSVEVKVYNRFGKLVYESSDYKNDWKGDFNGSPLPEASYYYIIKSAKKGIIKGVVNIIR